MGKEWLMILTLAFANDPIAKTEPPKAAPPPASIEGKASPPTTSSISGAVAPKTSAPVTQAKCDAAPYRALVGRTISDVLTMRLPPGTRIYRLGDPVTQPVPSGRLNIEINRGTRVGRIYCS
ncbi:MAG: hypothetical protein ACK5XZ_15080 [Hyphomonadaceae bacterium]|jgi:hypothetical protein|nr:hypothetical protein [Hyphomonadaceae bacterium]